MASIYKQFDAQDIVTLKKEITQGVFSDGSSTLTTFFTSSTQAAETSATGRALYHLDVYNANPASDSSAIVQFSLSYGHVLGYGSPLVSVDSSSRRHTQAVYNQYANTLLPKGQDKFKVYNGTTPDGLELDDIFIINFSRARIKEMLDAGNFSITIGGQSFIDDSSVVANPTVGPGGVVYNIVEGSIGSSITSASYVNGSSQGYGKIYPESGIVILNATAVASLGAFSLPSGNTSSGTYSTPHFDLYADISSVTARSAENVTSQNYFVRVRNTEFNFSNNPTYTTGSNNQIIDSLYNEPVTYITTIGMYNPTNELLAVAKLSRPVENGRDSETLIKVKVDF
jgi:hypothetical protein